MAHQRHRISETHTLKHEKNGQTVAICGFSVATVTSFARNFSTAGVIPPSCRECREAFDRATFEAQSVVKIGDKVEPEGGRYGYSPYKSVYKLLHNDTHVAFLVIENGWGKKWQVRAIDITVASEIGYTPLTSNRSRYAAALYIVGLMRDGKLDTAEEQRAAQRQWETDSAAAMARAQAESIRRAERKAAAKEALAAILAKNHLTNQERSGLIDAYNLLFGKDPDQ